MNAGQKLLAWRKRAGLTQRQAAKLACVSQPTWLEYENGRAPETKRMARIIELTEGAVTLADYAESEEDIAKRKAQREARTVRSAESGTDVDAAAKAAG